VRWRCGGSGAVLNKQARISKGLVLGASTRVQGCRLISKQGLGAGFYAVRFLCCEVKQISKVKVKCFVRVRC